MSLTICRATVLCALCATASTSAAPLTQVLINPALNPALRPASTNPSQTTNSSATRNGGGMPTIDFAAIERMKASLPGSPDSAVRDQPDFLGSEKGEAPWIQGESRR